VLHLLVVVVEEEGARNWKASEGEEAGQSWRALVVGVEAVEQAVQYLTALVEEVVEEQEAQYLMAWGEEAVGAPGAQSS
jgi:hypothetical protein